MACPGKWIHGLKPAVPLVVSFDPHPNVFLGPASPEKNPPWSPSQKSPTPLWVRSPLGRCASARSCPLGRCRACAPGKGNPLKSGGFGGAGALWWGGGRRIGGGLGGLGGIGGWCGDLSCIDRKGEPQTKPDLRTTRTLLHTFPPSFLTGHGLF